MKPSILVLAAAGLLAGCGHVDTTPPRDTHVVCNARTLDWTIGREADDDLVRRAQLESTAKIVRVLKPGQVVTMEYSDQRLNIYVDADNKVTSYSCG
jgi:hypothetical protein